MSWNQLGLDFSQPVAQVSVAKTTRPVIKEDSIETWAAKMCIPILILASAYAGNTGMRRPLFLPSGILEGAASLAAEAYGLGICNFVDENPDEELSSASSLFPSHRIMTGGE